MKRAELKEKVIFILDARFPDARSVERLKQSIKIEVACDDILGDLERNALRSDFNAVCAEIGSGIAFSEMARRFTLFMYELRSEMVEHLESKLS